jgi:hypothetical protein
VDKLCIVFIDQMGFGLIFSPLPFYPDELDAGPFWEDCCWYYQEAMHLE